MAEIGASLSLELSRIIDCQYPASLAILTDLLVRADVPTIQACLQNRPPCAVKKLATLVYDALPLWEYTLRLLNHLCQSLEFRHELLLSKPGLLDSFLEKANASQKDFDEYAELCVLLLSTPLPQGAPLPAAAQTFFLNVFKKATQDPNVSTIKPIYSMLNASCQQILHHLPVEARHHFDRQLCHILSSNGAGQNALLLMWCFGIVLLAEHPNDLDTTSSNLTQSLPKDVLLRQWKTSSGQKLFGSTKGLYKTMTLTCMNVVWATKCQGVSRTEALEAIRIASKIIQCVDPNVRKTWLKSGALAENTFQKLFEKIKRIDIDQAVRLEALCFYAMLAGQGNLHPEAVILYGQCLTDITQFSDAQHSEETLALSIPLFSPQIRDSCVQMLLESMLDTCVDVPSTDHLVNFHTLIKSVSTAVATCEPVRAKLLTSFMSTTAQEKTWKIIRSSPIIKETDCFTYTESIHREIASATIALLLTLALTASIENEVLPSSLVIALIHKQREMPSVEHKCSHAPDARARKSISIFQQGSTPYTGQHLQDWRARLRSDLESQSTYQRDLVIHSVAQICQDLDTRCSTVEEPLRRERERYKELEQLLKQSNETISHLENERIDDRLHLEGLEYDKERLSVEKERLLERLEELNFDLIETKKREADAMHALEEGFQAKELELQSTILQHEENASALSAELEKLNSIITQQKETREQQEQNQLLLNEQLKTLQSRLYEAEINLEKECEQTNRQAQVLTSIETRCHDLESQLEGMEIELEATTKQLGDLEVTHQESIQTSGDTLRETIAKYQNEMEVKAGQVEEERQKLVEQLDEALEQGQNAQQVHDAIWQDLELLRASASTMEIKVQELTDVCSEQVEELDELRMLRRNVLASMGLASQKPLEIRPSSQSSSEAVNSRSLREPRKHTRRTSIIQSENDCAMSQESNSCADIVTVPGKIKPRQAFKIPKLRAPNTQNTGLEYNSTSKRSSSRKRAALRQMSPNRRHTTAGLTPALDHEEDEDSKPQSRKKRQSSFQNNEAIDCDMDDILVGTPLTGNFLAGTGKWPEDDDATTTEL